MTKKRQQHPNESAYEQGRELGLAALLERRNRTPEWFKKAGIWKANQIYKEKAAISHFIDGWLSNWETER